MEEHDKSLSAVLERLREVGLMLNGSKFKFGLPKLTFSSHELTSESMNPSEKRIAVIQDLRPPKDARKVKLFMGLI